MALGSPEATFEMQLPRAPYPGLRPFSTAEWPIFFGREKMTDEVIGRVIRQHLVVVHGDSGCGKSSLIRAGVLAQLEQERARSGVHWRTADMLPRDAPLRRLAQAISEAQGAADDPDHVYQVRRVLNHGADAPAALAELLGQRDGGHVCILIDQFEELFSFARRQGGGEAQLFADILIGLHANPPSGLYVILTMRSDFLGNCARYEGFAETVNRTQYLLPRMERAALLRAIREPARLYGGQVSPALADRLIADAGGGQDQLPLIQHGLMLLWRRKLDRASATRASPSEQASLAEDPGVYRHRPGPAWTLDLSDYRESGGLARLLSDHADEVMHEVAPDEPRQKIVEHLFRALTDTNADGHAIRRPQTVAQLQAVTGAGPAILGAILRAFRAEGVSFLSPYGEAPLEPGQQVDISHEALIRSWRRIDDPEDGWLRHEFRDGLVWKTLLVAAGKDETLSAAATADRTRWLRKLPSEVWAERYGGGWGQVKDLLERSHKLAMRREGERQKAAQERIKREEELREEQRRRAEDAIASHKRQRRWTMAALGTAVIAIVAAAYAFTESRRADLSAAQARAEAERADSAAAQARAQARRADFAAIEARAEAQRANEAVIETKAASYWNGLQLWNDPLRPQDVATLWNLAQEDETVRVAFVRQLADNPALLAQFGFKPEPVARAVGLRWPDEARDIIEQSVGQVASDQFDPKQVQPFELVSHARLLAVLPKVVELDQATLASGTEKISSAIDDIAGATKLTDQQLWALAELVGVGFESNSIEAARNKLLEILRAAEPNDSLGWRGQALSRAIEAMAPDLTAEERSRAVAHLTPLLGQNTDSWAAKAHPRALTRLLPAFDQSQSDAALSGVPPALARAALQAGTDSSYLLSLMQVAEALADDGDQAAVEAFGQALIDQFNTANQPRQRAALARAAIPLLPRLPGGPTAINRQVANITSLVPDSAALDPDGRLDAVQRSLLREAAMREAADALGQAVSPLETEQKVQQAEAALQILRAQWSAQASGDAGPDLFLRAAQARLLAELAPSLTEPSAALAATHALAMLRNTPDLMAREAIARVLAALAPKLAGAERDRTLEAAKGALAMTGATEEAAAWARAIAALVPAEPGAATAEIVEVLKYPTATGAPSDILLAALAEPWPGDYEDIKGRTLPDAFVWGWLERHLPSGHTLTAPPPKPPILEPEAAGAAPG